MEETKTLGPDFVTAPETGAVGVNGEPGLDPGDLVSRYVLLYRLGQGGMGVVWAAYDPDLDRKVALKLLRTEDAAGEEQERLLLEARAMALLDHPNIVKVYDVGTFGDRVFLVMEYMCGTTLRTWLGRRRRSWRHILRVFQQAGRGLAAAHEAGLLHRDFKPSNVMIGTGGEVKVLDFGLAQRLPPENWEEEERPAFKVPESQSATPSGGPSWGRSSPTPWSSLYGTPSYMAPERLQGGPANPRSDQFSFCVALHEALFSKRPPAAGDSVASRAAGACRRPVPRWLKRAVGRGLAASPKDRFPSVPALLEALSPRPRRMGFWTSAVAALALVSLLPLKANQERSAAAQRCAATAEALEGIWDEETRQALRSSFSASGSPRAEDSYRRFSGALDDYTAEWTAMRRDACESTYVRGEQSQQLLDLTMLCLSRSLGSVAVLTRLLRSADRQAVARAPERISSLPLLSLCADRGALLDLEALPDAPRAVAALEEAAFHLETIHTRSALGLAVTKQDLDESYRAISRLPHRPLRAEALDRLAGVYFNRSEWEAAAEVYHASLRAAVESGYRQLEALAYSNLATMASFHLGDLEGGEMWAGLAAATLSSVAVIHPEMEARILHSLGVVAFTLGDSELAAERYGRALEVAERAYGKESIYLALYLEGASLVPSEGIDPIATFGRALKLREQQFGPSDFRLHRVLNNLGAAYARAGRYEEALAAARRAYQVLEMEDEASPGLGLPLLLRAQILLALERPEEAEQVLHRAVPSLLRGYGEDHFLVGVAFQTLSEVRLEELRLEEAAADLERARALFEASLPEEHPYQYEALGTLGRLHLASGEVDRAMVALKRSAEYPGGEARFRGQLLIALAQAHLDLEGAAAGRPFAERALEAVQEGSDPSIYAEALFTLARCLDPEEGNRARASVRAAHRTLIGTRRTPRITKLSGDLERWISSRGEASGNG